MFFWPSVGYRRRPTMASHVVAGVVGVNINYLLVMSCVLGQGKSLAKNGYIRCTFNMCFVVLEQQQQPRQE